MVWVLYFCKELGKKKLPGNRPSEHCAPGFFIRTEGTSGAYSQALTPGVASFLPGEGSTFCGLNIRRRCDSQLPPPLHAAETKTNYITGRIHANRGKHIGNFTMATAGACAS